MKHSFNNYLAKGAESRSRGSVTIALRPGQSPGAADARGMSRAAKPRRGGREEEGGRGRWGKWDEEKRGRGRRGEKREEKEKEESEREKEGRERKGKRRKK